LLDVMLDSVRLQLGSHHMTEMLDGSQPVLSSTLTLGPGLTGCVRDIRAHVREVDLVAPQLVVTWNRHASELPVQLLKNVLICGLITPVPVLLDFQARTVLVRKASLEKLVTH